MSSGGALAFTATARGPAEYVGVAMVHGGGGVHTATYTPEAEGLYQLTVEVPPARCCSPPHLTFV